MKRALGVLFLVWIVSTGYIAGFATPSIFYMANVVAHVFLGGALLLAGARFLPRPALVLLGLSTLAGVYLAWQGALIANQPILAAHIVIGVAGLLLLWRIPSRAYRMAFAAAVLIALGALAYERAFPDPKLRISNSLIVPTSMEEEGAGPKSPFWPSSANTNVNRTIPSDFFMDSKLCGSCHKDIYEQWESSMHHFASFNNQFYRKSIEHMQELNGVKGSKWCAACHDHAVFFNGRFEKPIKDQIDTPEAQAGLGCLSCHAISHVNGTMGNSGFIIEYPPLHELASSRNPLIRKADEFLTYLDPEPHRRTFLKPFMREQRSEFCSACHKVHLDEPVNNYRWLRGFNDYDNWQASGVSGQGARSFYYPAQTSTCNDCHMPLVDSNDPGNRKGKVHNHRFAAANTAVPYANRDGRHLAETVKFLTSGFITVDIFAASPVNGDKREIEMRRRADSPVLSSTFAQVEETGGEGPYFLREVGQVAAPVDRAGVKFQPGGSVRLDVVVRTRKIGHSFPAGTVDSFDIWLEVTGKDATGRTIFLSGNVEDGGKGAVEPGAHFYRSYQLDGAGNPINKRNAWQTRGVLYVRLIPPGAADVAHYRVNIPKGAKGPIQFEAKLNYRKFSHFYTQYAYAGQPVPGDTNADPSHDSRAYTFVKTNIPKNVSGAIKDEIPTLPIITLAAARASLALAAPGEATTWAPAASKPDRERWNDWGIGLLLQGDLKGAEYAFRKVTEAEPEYADGWLNVARALIQEGETEAARPFIQQALRLDSKLGRVHFFQAMIDKAAGDYDKALASLALVEAQYPRDRVVLNQMGRVRFLQKKYAEAVTLLERVILIDPEDLQAHYTLMLCYRGLGRLDEAAREEKLFRRFKANETSQEVTFRRRMISPEDNNERQTIHEHESSHRIP
ncbi:MAG: tetratricopeptide repeat protein [Bryobacterales bacterium]|nr:tetratricopeptide repeat protein [Bryobacterales bacterium]